jgi:hypothetical protein
MAPAPQVALDPTVAQLAPTPLLPPQHRTQASHPSDSAPMSLLTIVPAFSPQARR